MRRKISLVSGSPYSTFGTVTLRSHTYRRPSHRRGRGMSAAVVFVVLLVVASIEAAWFLQPVWRGALTPTVVLAEATLPDAPVAIGETSVLFLRSANEALLKGRWVEASVAFDRAADLDAAPPTATIAAARTLLGTHRIDDAVYREI